MNSPINQLNLIMSLLLGCFSFYSIKTLHQRNKLNKIYLYIVFIYILIFIINILILLDLNSEIIILKLHLIYSLLLIIKAYYLYIFFRFYFKKSNIENKKVLYLNILIVTLSITITTTFIFFSKDNVDFFKIHILLKYVNILAICLIYITSLIQFIKNKKFLFKGEKQLILLSIFINMLLEIYTVILLNNNFIFTINLLPIVFVYLIILNNETFTDKLTNLKNRRAFDYYIENELKKVKGNVIILNIDLDHFKSINDNYGHLEGDNALIIFSESLTNIFSGKGIICRIGGDEFSVICQIKNTKELLSKIKLLKNEINLINLIGGHQFRLLFSYGYEEYNKHEAIEPYLKRIDKKMYANKLINRYSKNK